MYPISHVGLVVKDCRKSADFYKRILGCELVETYRDNRVNIIFLKAGEGRIELVQYLSETADVQNGGVINHLAFEVENLHEAVARLKKLGVPLLTEEPKKVLGGTRLMINFTGPDGEKLEFSQVVRS